MADFKVSRMQMRRGQIAHLPQPLRPGEFGWCVDTNRLFIGGSPSQVPPAIGINPGFLGSVSSLLSDAIIVATVDNTFVFADFLAWMDGFVDEYLTTDSQAGRVYMAMTPAQISANAYTSISSRISSFEATTGVQLGITADIHNGEFFETATHGDSRAIATLINSAMATSAVNSKLNVEVLTEYSQHPQFRKVTLSNTSAVWTDMPVPTGAEFDFLIDLSTGNSVDMLVYTYSAIPEEETESFKEMGKLEWVADNNDVTGLVHTANRIGSQNVLLEFRLFAVPGGAVQLQYRTSTSMTFKYKLDKWSSEAPYIAAS